VLLDPLEEEFDLPAIPVQRGDRRGRDGEIVGEKDKALVDAARFERRGLAGLIAWPAGEPLFTASVLGAARPPWAPHTDPPLDTLAAAYEFILACGPEITAAVGVQR